MFDLIELDQAESALRALARGDLPPVARAPALVEPRREPAQRRCPFADARRGIAA